MGIIGGILANFIPYFLKKESIVFIILVTILYSLVFLILNQYFHVEPVNIDSKTERPNLIVGIRQCLHNSRVPAKTGTRGPDPRDALAACLISRDRRFDAWVETM